MDDWDNGFIEQDAKPATTTSTKQNVPEGLHTLKIKSFEQTDSGYKLTLTHEDRSYFWVQHWFNKNHSSGPQMLTQFREALGLNAQEWKLSTPESLSGQTVRVDIAHVPGKTPGKVFANVTQFIAAPDEPAWEKDERKPAARTPAAKVKAANQGGDEDSLPF